MKPRELEELALTAWPALEHWVYDGWMIRFAGGHTRRANSVTPLYPSSENPQTKIAQCEQWYTARQLPTIFRLTSWAAPHGLDQLLDERGYQLADPSLTLHRRLDTWAASPEQRAIMRSEDLPTWLTLYHELTGRAGTHHPVHAAILQRTPRPRIFASLWADDQVVACAVGVIHARAVSIVDVVTSPHYRKQGYGTALLSQLFSWAQQLGVTDASLQVQGDNAAARALYARLGFHEVYTYWYRVRQ